jgi:hypothetical protein
LAEEPGLIFTLTLNSTEDGLIIPTLPVEDAKTGDPVKIDNEVPGWAYAEKPVGITRV